MINDVGIKPDSIQWLVEIPKRNSRKVFLVDDLGNVELTFDKLYESACAIGNSLKEQGLKKGDRIAVLMNNSSNLVKLYFGMLYSGLVVVPINPLSTKQEIEYIIYHSNSKLVVVTDETLEKIDPPILKEKNIDVFNLSTGPNTQFKIEHVKQWRIDELSSSSPFVPFQGVSATDDIVMVYTSGTTAEPKAVIHRISDLVDNARLFGKTMGISSNNRFYNILSLTYLGGYYNLLLLPYVCESSVTLARTFDPKTAINFWTPIIKNKVNTLWLVPSIMSILMETDRGKDGIDYCKSTDFLVLVGTAPLPVQLKHDFEKRYGIKIYENYGLSETLFISTTAPNNMTNNGVGKILEGINIRVVDVQGEELSSNSEGEILVQTPYLMRGYYDPRKGIDELTPGESWFDTGDLGFISSDKMLYITGRKKDLIIRGGINISPLSIENVIREHPMVLECAVVGIPHKFQGEEIVAVVRLNESADFNKVKEELSKLCKTHLSTIKQPSQFVHLSEFPRATYGKIQKSKIRTWLIQKQAGSIQEIQKNVSVRESTPEKSHDLSLSKIVVDSVEALSIKYNTMVYEKQRKGEDVIVLSLGEAFFDIPLLSFDILPLQKIYHYSHSRGIPELREKISKYFFETYDVTFDYETEILVTAGSKIGIHMCLMSIINPGDEVVILEPAWVSFPEQIKLCHGVPIRVPYHKSLYDLEEFISAKTKMIIINNPNNPTGKIYSLEELTHLYQLAKKFNLVILSDEAYSDFVINKDEFISFANLDIKKERSIVINSISKNFGISGWRLGYVITNSILINQILKLNQHLITCAPTILEYYVAQYFDHIINITKPQIKNLVKKRLEIKEYMDSISLKYLPGTSTFYFFISIEDSKLISEEFCSQLLQNYHVSAVPGIGYGTSCDKFIRVSVGAESVERIKKGLHSIKNLISKTSN